MNNSLLRCLGLVEVHKQIPAALSVISRAAFLENVMAFLDVGLMSSTVENCLTVSVLFSSRAYQWLL